MNQNYRNLFGYTGYIRDILKGSLRLELNIQMRYIPEILDCVDY